MSTSTEIIPQISTVNTVAPTDQFLVKDPSIVIPEKTAWRSMLIQALTSIPPGYFG